MSEIRARRRLRATSLLLISSLTYVLAGCGTYSGYRRAVAEACESVLRDDLSQMRKQIAQYRTDHGRLPQSLDDLVRAGYMREIPVDPLTGQRDWRVI